MKTLFIFGTRPEAIKMAPLIKALLNDPFFQVSVCVTGQHRQMLDQVLSFFQITPDYDINLMKPNQTLFDITADALKGLHPVLQDSNPEFVFVQGDTTTAFIGAVAAYYHRAKIAHVEAGLRSFNLQSPFPEEGNRAMIGRLTNLHFVPTKRAANNLISEGITEGIHMVGNTVIDALLLGLDLIKKKGDDDFRQKFPLSFTRKIVLITGHRRESFGEPFRNICHAIKTLASENPDVDFIYPVHFNPNVRAVVGEILTNLSNVHLIEPLDYQDLIWLMNKSYLVLTDSGGIQEEAPSLGKPVLVMRDVTERQEGVEAGTARLVGTNANNIVTHAQELLTSPQSYSRMANAVNPYGDGNTSGRIVEILKKQTVA